MNLTQEHIILTLGINLPLNESFKNLNDQLKNSILYEQMLYESFLDSVKKYAGEKWNKVITTVKDWKDAAIVLGKIIADPTTLQNFSENFWKTFKTGLLLKLKTLLQKTGLDNYIPQVETLVDNINSLTGWKKFLAATSIASITQYIVSKLSTLSVEGLTKWIKAYFSGNVLNTIFDKLTDFSTYIGWLQPIIKGTEILFDVLKPTINKFKAALSFFKENINIMKKQHLKQLIEEEIKNILDKKLDEATSPEPQPKKSSPEVEKLIAYLEGSGKTALNQVNNRIELNDILTAIFNGMNDTMKKDSTVITIGKLKDTRLK